MVIDFMSSSPKINHNESNGGGNKPQRTKKLGKMITNKMSREFYSWEAEHYNLLSRPGKVKH